MDHDYRWLVSGAAGTSLQFAAECSDPLAAARALRKELGESRARLVLSQAALRKRGRLKFSRADELFFTGRGLEQATGETVAAYKAGRFPLDAPVADLCSGIGGDLMALAARCRRRRGAAKSNNSGAAIGVDRDPIASIFAEANCRAMGSLAAVHVAEAEEAQVAAARAWHIDPDRRPGGKRTTAAERFEPNGEAISRLLRANEDAAVKLAPATVAPEPWRGAAELEWIGHDRECKQQVAWFGRLAGRAGMRRATVLFDDGRSPASLSGEGIGRPPLAEEIGRFVFDPHAAVLAAGMAGDAAILHGLSALSAAPGYLTGDKDAGDPLLAAFEVLDVLPFDRKRLAALLRRRRIGRLEIKARGIDISPEKLRRELQPRGDEPITLLIAKSARATLAILAKRNPPK